MKKNILKLDKGLNKELKYEITDLKKCILNTAEIQNLPSRFKTEDVIGLPKKRIINLKTGKETIVPIFAYQNVREALNNLFSQ